MQIDLNKKIRDLIKKYKISAKKSFGQNFLINSEVLEKILETAEIKENDNIIEIGPGLGVLTDVLTQSANKVTTIELDKSLIPILEEEFADRKNLEIINQDALKFSPPKEKYKIVANIPYNITSPLINHFLTNKNPPTSMTLLVQKEVAEKICAPVPDMSILALQVQLFGIPEFIKKIPPTAFIPAPKIDSAIIHIKTLKTPNKKAQEILKLAKQAFSQKRKKLSNTIPQLIEQLKTLKLNEKRPQHLSIKDWERDSISQPPHSKRNLSFSPSQGELREGKYLRLAQIHPS